MLIGRFVSKFLYIKTTVLLNRASDSNFYMFSGIFEQAMKQPSRPMTLSTLPPRGRMGPVRIFRAHLTKLHQSVAPKFKICNISKYINT